MSAAHPDWPSVPAAGARRPGPRNLGLDVARSAAILMVLVSHVATAGGASPRASAMLETMGQSGVELFFSLSGFLIGGILLRMAQQGLSPGSVMRFLLRRWLRTLPLYYVLLLAAGAWFGMGIGHSALLIQNFYPTEPRPLPVSWSLVMEEYFYLAFPLVMLTLHSAGVRGPRLVGWTACGLIALCSSIRLWNAYGFGPGWSAPFVHENPLLRMDCAAYGAVAAWLVHTSVPNAPARPMRFIVGGLAIAGATAAVFVWVLGASVGSLVQHGFMGWGPAFLALQTTAINAGFALVVVGLARVSLQIPAVLSLSVTWISLVSYSVYLLHLPIIGAITQTSFGTGFLRSLASIAATMAAATLTHLGVERPILKLRDNWIAEGGSEGEKTPSSPRC